MRLSEKDHQTLMTTLQTKSPEVLQVRMANALLLLADGLSVEDVAGLLFLDEETVAGWQKMFSRRKAA